MNCVYCGHLVADKPLVHYTDEHCPDCKTLADIEFRFLANIKSNFAGYGRKGPVPTDRPKKSKRASLFEWWARQNQQIDQLN